jgi:transcriptional regulator with PAS, ATPase and Fis domain
VTLRPNYFEVPELAEEQPDMATALAQFRQWIIGQALMRSGGNLVAAARELGIGYSTLKMYVSVYRRGAA